MSRREWVVIATAPHQLPAEVWREFLHTNGIPSMLQAGDAVSFLGVTPFPCRLLVPQDYAEEARRLLEELTSAAPLEEETEGG